MSLLNSASSPRYLPDHRPASAIGTPAAAKFGLDPSSEHEGFDGLLINGIVHPVVDNQEGISHLSGEFWHSEIEVLPERVQVDEDGVAGREFVQHVLSQLFEKLGVLKDELGAVVRPLLLQEIHHRFLGQDEDVFLPTGKGLDVYVITDASYISEFSHGNHQIKKCSVALCGKDK